MIPALEALGFQCRTIEQTTRPDLFSMPSASKTRTVPTVLGYATATSSAASMQAGARRRAMALSRDGGPLLGPRRRPTTRASTPSISRALAAVLKARGALGFNAKWLIEMGEETGSRGLREVCRDNKRAVHGGRLPRLRRPAPDCASGRRSFSDHAAAPRSTFGSMRAKVGTTRATGAVCSRARRFSSRTRCRLSQTRRDVS